MARASRTGVAGLWVSGKGKDRRYGINLRWRDLKTGEPHRYQQTFPAGISGAEAKRLAHEIGAACRAGTFVPKAERREPPRLETAFAAYVEAMRTEGLSSVKSRVTHGKLFSEVLGADRELATLVPLDVERVKKHLRDAKREPGTINRHLTTFKHFCRWAAKHDRMPRDVAARLREDVRPLREPAGRVRWIRDDEEEKFAGLGGWLGTLARAARLTGMRLSELVTMRGAQVDRKGATITLPKTKSGRLRLIPITPGLSALLPEKVAASAYVFHVPQGESTGKAKRTEDERRRDYTSLAFGRWVESVGIADLTFHDLRHDFATRVRRAGHGLDVVASALGHGTLQMSARYAHIGDPQRDAAFNAVRIGWPLAESTGGKVVPLKRPTAETP